jgi:hypothetical protein
MPGSRFARDDLREVWWRAPVDGMLEWLFGIAATNLSGELARSGREAARETTFFPDQNDLNAGPGGERDRCIQRATRAGQAWRLRVARRADATRIIRAVNPRRIIAAMPWLSEKKLG